MTRIDLLPCIQMVESIIALWIRSSGPSFHCEASDTYSRRALDDLDRQWRLLYPATSVAVMLLCTNGAFLDDFVHQGKLWKCRNRSELLTRPFSRKTNCTTEVLQMNS